MVAKRKMALQPSKGPEETNNPPKTVRRNARERNRVENIDIGFDKLKVHIPSTAQQKKISRVKILSSAVEYIQHLHALLHVTTHRNPELIKHEPHSPSLPIPPKSSYSSPQIPPHPSYKVVHHHYPQMYNQPPLMSPHNPISPGYIPPQHIYNDTASIASSGYYSSTNSQHFPGQSQLSPLIPGHRAQYTAGFTRESLSPGSHFTYSDNSLQSSFMSPVTPAMTEGYPDGQEDDIVDNIVNWENKF